MSSIPLNYTDYEWGWRSSNHTDIIGLPSLTNKAVDQWRTRLHTRVKAKGNHLEHLLQTSADFRHDPTNRLFHSHSQKSLENSKQYH